MENYWSVVYFTEENSVEAVPNIWLDKKRETCAWPAKPKYVKKFIELQQKPNKKDFTYHPARKLGKKSYTSLAETRAKLPKATRMSDWSSADDEVRKIKKRPQSISPDMIKTSLKTKKDHLANTCPGPKKYCDFIKEDCVATTSSLVTKKSIFDDLLVPSDSSNADDSDTDPLWKLNKSTSNDHNTISISPTPSPKKSTVGYSKVLCSPSANWTVDNIDKNIIYENDENDENGDTLRVKRVLFPEHNIPKKSKIFQNESNTSTQNNFNIESFKSHNPDYEKYIFTTVTHMKYDINKMMSVINVMHTNIESLMDSLTSKSVGNCALSRDNHQDVDLHSIFPINTEEQLTSIESKIIQDTQFRNILVSKLSLIAVASDLGHSLRRIVAKMFDDEFLVNYSLIGFKKKKPFTKLMLYRVIIDSLRMHVKYKMATDREIELPLGVWLAHAPFRLLKKLK